MKAWAFLNYWVAHVWAASPKSMPMVIDVFSLDELILLTKLGKWCHTDFFSITLHITSAHETLTKIFTVLWQIRQVKQTIDRLFTLVLQHTEGDICVLQHSL